MSDNLHAEPDLTDPGQLAAECAALAGSCGQQAHSAANTGLGSHPDPAYFMARVSRCLAAAGKVAAAVAELPPSGPSIESTTTVSVEPILGPIPPDPDPKPAKAKK